MCVAVTITLLCLCLTLADGEGVISCLTQNVVLTSLRVCRSNSTSWYWVLVDLSCEGTVAAGDTSC